MAAQAGGGGGDSKEVAGVRWDEDIDHLLCH
jgi:hypothetical protein